MSRGGGGVTLNDINLLSPATGYNLLFAAATGYGLLPAAKHLILIFFLA